jgi:hypothetical protein
MIIVGGLVLVVASLMALFSTNVYYLGAALFVGAGVEFYLIAGSSLMAESLAVERAGGRSRVLANLWSLRPPA